MDIAAKPPRCPIYLGLIAIFEKIIHSNPLSAPHN